MSKQQKVAYNITDHVRNLFLLKTDNKIGRQIYLKSDA